MENIRAHFMLIYGYIVLIVLMRMAIRFIKYKIGLIKFFPKWLEGGNIMKNAIWLPAGEMVIVRLYDSINKIAVIEHDDGRLDRVAENTIHLLVSPEH